MSPPHDECTWSKSHVKKDLMAHIMRSMTQPPGARLGTRPRLCNLYTHVRTFGIHLVTDLLISTVDFFLLEQGNKRNSRQSVCPSACLCPIAWLPA